MSRASRPAALSLCALCLCGCAVAQPEHAADGETLALVCRTLASAPGDRGCTAVPSLVEGSLRLAADGRFALSGRYEACYAIEEVEIGGRYATSRHAGGTDVELLADEAPGEGQARTIGRTLGVLSLDAARRDARFVDTAAVVRARGLASETPPSVAMRCDAG